MKAEEKLKHKKAEEVSKRPESSAATPSVESPLINRELSWIEFNSRVLGEALSPSHPILERLKFLSIFSTNLDEFFMVRVSGLQGQLADNPTLSPDGLSPASQLRLISERLRPLLDLQMKCLTEQILPKLEELGVRIISYTELTDHQRDELSNLYNERIFPVLTPLSVDPSHPFPYISNISLNLGTVVVPEHPDEDDTPRFARVKLPPKLPRLIPVDGGYNFVLLEELVAAHIGTLFPGMRSSGMPAIPNHTRCRHRD